MKRDPRAWRLGIDIGGTFTDGVLWNLETGERSTAKVLSTPDDLSRGFIDVVRRLLGSTGVEPSQVGYVAHGTTVATNAVLEHDLARIGYVTTKGFRDVFEIARQVRPDPYDVFTEKPPPLVPRQLCLEVDERTTAEGTIWQPLDESGVAATVKQLQEANVESVAVCLLHSYANPEHERRVGALLREALPMTVVSLSSDLAPEFREYPRACTVVINAGLVPVVASYLEKLEGELAVEGLEAELRVMQSNGGVLSFQQAREKPVRILESGPAAGVMGAVRVGEVIGVDDLVSFDMGGTTAKLGLIRGGRPRMSQEFEIGPHSRTRDWFSGASGYPILTPSVDLVEIGAGGGSVAWVDSGGKLRVGPRSAGAKPGPACYGLGGTEATITDANLVLGRLNPSRLLGGDLSLDEQAAHDAVGAVASTLGKDVVETAAGIVTIANSAMVRAVRMVSVQRGYDARAYMLAAFGGAGPLHALALADEMSMQRVIVQPQPGLASALGLLVTDTKHEYSSTWIRATGDVEPDDLEQRFQNLEGQAREALQREGLDEVDVRYERALDMRYSGQSYQLVVACDGAETAHQLLARAVDRFHEVHNANYGHADPSEPTEIVNVRVTGSGVIRKPSGLARWPHAPEPGVSENRRVYFDGHGFVDTPVWSRAALQPGWAGEGPAVIEEIDSTTLVHPGWTVTVLAGFELLLNRADDA